MKVLHVIPSLWSGDGGPAQALACMERALAAQGVEVETATTDDAGPGRRNGKKFLEPHLENGSTRRYFPKRTDTYKFAPALSRWLAANARAYDVIHLHALFSFTTTAGARAARRQGIPYVVRPLGTLDEWGLAGRRPWLKRASLAVVEAPALRAAAAVHFTSEAEAQQARSLGIAMREAVIPLGVDVPADATARGARAAPVTALYLSRLAPKKNLEGLLEALALSPDPQLRLLVAGAGDADYAAGLRARAQDLGVAARVEWLGHVEGEAKRRAFERADFFVLPSHSENFGIAAAEALAHALPCVLGRGVALAAQVHQAGAGVATGTSAPEIAAALRFMMPPQTREAMSAQALRVARERLSTEAMGARLKQLYSDIVAGRHGLPAKH